MESQAGPIISVLMGVLNCENTLDESLESIAAQTERRWECVICDDGSTDRTAEMIQGWQKRFPDQIIFLQNEKNRGLAPTLNRCLAAAHGQFIARMDGDDRCSPERFEKELAYLTAHPEKAIVSTDMRCFDENGFWGYRAYPTDPEPLDLIHGVPFCHPAVMVRKEALEDCGGYSESDLFERVEDYELWVRMYASGYKGHNIHEALYLYRDDRNAAVRRKWKYRINEARVKRMALKQLQLPLWNFVFVLRPLVLGMLPGKISNILHRGKLKRGRI